MLNTSMFHRNKEMSPCAFINVLENFLPCAITYFFKCVYQFLKNLLPVQLFHTVLLLLR